MYSTAFSQNPLILLSIPEISTVAQKAVSAEKQASKLAIIGTCSLQGSA
jgi:hypothetical protein